MRGCIAAAAIFILCATAAPAQQDPVTRRCLLISGTGDGLAKEAAKEAAQSALDEAIANLQVQQNFMTYTATPWKPEPKPYWRSSIGEHLFLPPDEITDQRHTICWRGVVSPAVCTSGSKVCW